MFGEETIKILSRQRTGRNSKTNLKTLKCQKYIFFSKAENISKVFE